MATPHAAGHTALVRQYLRTGFYPTGSPADAAAAPFTPSGMLLKVRCACLSPARTCILAACFSGALLATV